MKTLKVVIEDWDGDGAIRIPDEVLQELGVDVGDSLYTSRGIRWLNALPSAEQN